MWWRSDDVAITVTHSLQLTLVFFRSLIVYPYPVSLCLCAATNSCPYMNPGVHTIELVLLRFIYNPTHSKILTTTVRVFCTHMGLRTTMRPSSAYKTMLYYTVDNINPCCASCGPQDSSSTTITTSSTCNMPNVLVILFL